MLLIEAGSMLLKNKHAFLAGLYAKGLDQPFYPAEWDIYACIYMKPFFQCSLFIDFCFLFQQ